MRNSTAKPVLVGLDGSPTSFEAVRWAAREASLRSAPLHVVHADVSASDYVPDTLGTSAPESADETAREFVRDWLRSAAEIATAEAPEVVVETGVRTGSARTVLLDESATARIVVVGSRGLGSFSGVILGSVAIALCQHGQCPVAVVREPDDGEEATDRPIVVGVDGSSASEPALRWAFETASARSAALLAVHAWHDLVVGQLWTREQAEEPRASVQADEERLLSEVLAGWRADYPDVAVHELVTYGKPARCLLEQARTARFVVVGARGRGGLAGLLLGSTSQTLLHHSPCPVVVAR
ncbi:nucleotide-binding universal stress UspA family protein [Actinopolyspora biskrensis]|uniref:Nucleotide-binding universal stress UspA family protein n=1 Tax=Actinopolyspora biskrensis TaxID=1470178 RepID=A0A852YWC6_9ACTN|nr:universal stress protein [Actinopolyspora biskrensis]NYH78368.1 nucleotide-binding universal stress UspA family protein [Actinopolyspora biskrensis]